MPTLEMVIMVILPKLVIIIVEKKAYCNGNDTKGDNVTLQNKINSNNNYKVITDSVNDVCRTVT